MTTALRSVCSAVRRVQGPGSRAARIRLRLAVSPVAALALSCAAFAADVTVHIVEPAITDHMILPDEPLPEVCKPSTLLTVRACPGEYEPASFVISTTQPLEAVGVEVGRLAGAAGTWPETAVDVRVVKSCYRRAPAGGATVMPTLLVHDEEFLSIEPAPTADDPDRLANVSNGPLRDSATLRPVRIEKRKQFWVTVHVPATASPGDYSGPIRVVGPDGGIAELSLRVHVYPFALAAPMIEYSIYYPAYLEADRPAGHPSAFGDLTAEQLAAEFRNMAAHGLLNPNIYDAPGLNDDGTLDFAKLERILHLREQAGMRPQTLYFVGHRLTFADRPLTPEEKQRVRQYVTETRSWARARGYPEVFFMAADEWWGEQLSRERDSIIAVTEAGAGVFTAVMQTTFYDRVGDVLTRPVLLADTGAYLEHAAGRYSAAESLKHMAEIGRSASFAHMRAKDGFRKAIDGIHRQGRKIFTYMNPTAGTPLPDLQRRNEGLGLWRVGFDGTMTWAYAHIEGDRVEQPMQFAMVYRTENGVLDTLHWEGFREGVDDVRYLTTLFTTLNETTGRLPEEALVAETQAWLRELDVAKGDLDAIRRDMAARIVALRSLGKRHLSPQEFLAGVDIGEVRITPFPEPWRFRPDPGDQGVGQRWFAADTDLADWGQVRTDVDKGWEKQGYAEQADGYGWYRAALPAKAADMAKAHRYLHFGAVDEDAWIYLNGELVFEHTFETTGLLPSQIWFTAFSAPLDGVAVKGDDALVVRVKNTGGMGGVWKPVHLVCTDQPLTAGQLGALIQHRRSAKE